MIEEKIDSGDLPIEAKFEFPPPARFDERASANAQPVQRLPRSRTVRWIRGAVQPAIESARNTRQLFAWHSKGMALALTGGLAVGALGGTLLVSNQAPTAEPRPAMESSAETNAVQTAPNDLGQSNIDNSADAGATVLPRPRNISSRVRRVRNRPNIQRPRAYRVAVIR